MNMRWQLNDLYTSFKSESFQYDLNRLDEIIIGFENWMENNLNSNGNIVKKLEEYIIKRIECEQIFDKLDGFTLLTSIADTENEEADEYDSILSQKNIDNIFLKCESWIAKLSDIEKYFECSDILREHSFYITKVAKGSLHMLTDREEDIIACMKNTGSKSWYRLRDTVISNHMIQYEENALTLNEIRKMAYDKDPIKRKKAYEKEIKAYENIKKIMAICLNSIKGEVITLSKFRKYESPLHMTLDNINMDKETLDAMLLAIHESLPKFRSYFKKKSLILNHPNGLPFYDLFAPIGNSYTNFSYEEAKNYIVKYFSMFSNKLASFANEVFNKGWIDSELRKGKIDDSACVIIPPIKQSRIIVNFSGYFSDVINLAHELGHAYHNHLLFEENDSIINLKSPLPLAETASVFCESIITHAAINDALKEEHITIFDNQLSNISQLIVDIYSRFIFEERLFSRRSESVVAADELCNLMIEAQKETYGDGLDESYLHPYMWLCKSHYFKENENYYNFPYAFGLLFSKGLYALYLEQGKQFSQLYDEILKATGKNSVEHTAMIAGIDVRSVNFWKKSLAVIEKDIERFCMLF